MSSSEFSNTLTGVAKSMTKMALSDSLKTFLVSNHDLWESFGKMSSHLYRADLMLRMEKAELKPDEKFMVYVMFSVIKNQPRVIKAMKAMSEAEKNMTWYNPVFNFISNSICQYVTQATTTGKFPAVNIPSSNPGLDILIFQMTTKPENCTLENLKNRPTFSQLNLNQEMQARAKEGYSNYWDNIVKGTKNTAKVEEPKMREEYYNTGANDKYRLLDIKLKEIPVPEGGYNEVNIRNYLRSLTIN